MREPYCNNCERVLANIKELKASEELMIKDKAKLYWEARNAEKERDELKAALGQLKKEFSYLLSDIQNANKKIRELDSVLLNCKHPGCCCVCGHQGKCPEDGPSAIEGIAD